MGRMVIVAYRAHPDCAQRLRDLVARHVPALQEFGLASARPAMLMQAADGTLIEIFEWRSPEAIEAAHTHPGVQALWEEFATLCDFLPLAALPEAATPFAEFTPLL